MTRVHTLLTTFRRHRVGGPALRLPFVLLRHAGVPIPRRVYQHLWFEGAITVELPSGGRFRMHSYGDTIENSYYWAGVIGHERECVDPWVRFARASRVVLDIGANTGAYALMACAANPHANVHAFEPVPRVAEKARRNIAMNPGFNATVHEAAVGARSGTAMLSDPGGDNCYSASLDPTFLAGTKTRYSVQVLAIDDFVRHEKLPAVDLIKLDVEGFEEFAIDGMAETVEQHRPVLLIEYLPDARPSLRTRIADLCTRGYVLFHLTAEGPVLAQDVTPSRMSKNVMLIPAERVPTRWT